MREMPRQAKVYLAAGYALLMLLLVLGGMVDHAATCGVYPSPLP
jgi:hypothetical protein